ncbi:hypothetical protein [Kingella potus]|uniref:hypothetical protein n=1 Tax=Kingella potus TaxID=265175 RepID=UPI001FD59189|nr:hypothetical protein [Kingella potus]UOP00323.1 hypothetical protein LVJ84_10505 [Kingella potus]
MPSEKAIGKRQGQPENGFQAAVLVSPQTLQALVARQHAALQTRSARFQAAFCRQHFQTASDIPPRRCKVSTARCV